MADQRVLADVIVPPRTRVPAWVRDLGIVTAATAVLALFAQIVIPLPFTPVPLSLSTFAVILTGAALGPFRAAAATSLYLLVGLLGAPVFANGGSGWEFAAFGFVLGYIPAAWLVGEGARRGGDRALGSMLLAAVAGSAVIYTFGVIGLMSFLQVGIVDGLRMGVVPFLVGDAVKVAAAALVLPASWRFVERLGS